MHKKPSASIYSHFSVGWLLGELMVRGFQGVNRVATTAPFILSI